MLRRPAALHGEDQRLRIVLRLLSRVGSRCGVDVRSVLHALHGLPDDALDVGEGLGERVGRRVLARPEDHLEVTDADATERLRVALEAHSSSALVAVPARTEVRKRLQGIVQRLACVDIEEVAAEGTTRVIDVERYEDVEDVRDGEALFALDQRVRATADGVDLEAVRMSVAEDELLRLGRIEEALQHVARQVRVQRLSVHGAQALRLALLRVARQAERL